MRHGISIWIDVPLDILANEIMKTKVLTTASHATSDSDFFTEVVNVLSLILLSHLITSITFLNWR